MRTEQQHYYRTARHIVFERASYTCEIPGCCEWAADTHHYIPRSQGGSDSEKNLIALCRQHHSDIHSGYPELKYRMLDYFVEILSGYYKDWQPRHDCYRTSWLYKRIS